MESALQVAADHPAYAGHFPGHPLLPGVALLSEVMHAVAQATGRGPERWTVTSAKFLRPVVPGMALTLLQSATKEGGIRFEVRADGGIVASGTLSPRG